MVSCKCLSVVCPTKRETFLRDPSILCIDNSSKECNSADADSKIYDSDHA